VIDALHRTTHHAALPPHSMPTEQAATAIAPPFRGRPASGAVAFPPRFMRSRRTLHLLHGLAWLLAGFVLPVALWGCNCSPRQEYLQTRAVEIAPSGTGDGTLLANRDKIMTGDKGPSAPLAAVESPTPDKQ
jgi:hypothetical protein